MHESILRDFFSGRVGAADLRTDLVGAIVQTSSDVFSHSVVDMDADFEVLPEHLVRLCDAVLTEALEASDLEAIGFCLVASEHFYWDRDSPAGDRVAKTAHDWASPDINYRLTPETVHKFRERLLTGHDLFTRDDIAV
jgi:hypothetical protein